MLCKRRTRILTVAGLAAWACALPEQSAPPDGGAPMGGSSTGGSSTGGTTTGGSMTGGTTTGGTTTGGSTTGGTTTGGAGGAGSNTGGSAGSATGGTMSGSGGRGGAGAGGAGSGGTAGTAAGMGGTMGGAGAGGKGGTAGTGGSAGSSVLVHRYSFDGTGTTATDSVGTAHGTITGGSQSGGVLTLSGTEQYVTLPTTLLSGLTAATFEAWVSWTGGTSNWQRIFDFGNNDETMSDQGGGNDTAGYLFLTPRASGGSSTSCQNGTANAPRVAITGAGPGGESCGLGTATFPSGSTHVAVTIDSNTLALYIQGAPSGGSVAPAVSLSSISYSHNWLGRSQFAADTEFAGTISEFRIYGTARTAAQIQASYTAGENMVPPQ